MNVRRISLITALFWALSTAPAQAYPAQVERWRPIVHAELRRQRVHSDYIEAKILKLINGESTGNPRAGHVHGCYGLLQFNQGWVHGKDWRGDGRASIRVIVTLYRKHGVAPLRKHWKATW